MNGIFPHSSTVDDDFAVAGLGQVVSREYGKELVDKDTEPIPIREAMGENKGRERRD